jgi:galactose oxidase-like protein/Kelch motif protein
MHRLFFLLAACTSPTTPGAPTWQPIDSAEVAPRWGHTAQYDARTDTMLVFGGENKTGQLGELLAYHLDTGVWERLPTSPEIYARTDLASAIDTINNRLVLIGGRVGLATSIGDVVAYGGGQWQTLPRGPSPRHDVVAASDGTRAWLFGGAGEFLQSLDDLWQLDFATDTWTELPANGVKPVARGSNALAYHDGALYMVGGHDVTTVKRDVWRYDLTARTWSAVAIDSAPPAWAHFGQATDPACGTLVLVAGDNLDNSDTSLATTFDIATGAFARLATATLVTPRDHPSLIVDSTRHQLVLFGGGTLGDGLGTLHDAWALPLAGCP